MTSPRDFKSSHWYGAVQLLRKAFLARCCPPPLSQSVTPARTQYRCRYIIIRWRSNCHWVVHQQTVVNPLECCRKSFLRQPARIIEETPESGSLILNGSWIPPPFRIWLNIFIYIFGIPQWISNVHFPGVLFCSVMWISHHNPQNWKCSSIVCSILWNERFHSVIVTERVYVVPICMLTMGSLVEYFLFGRWQQNNFQHSFCRPINFTVECTTYPKCSAYYYLRY